MRSLKGNVGGGVLNLLKSLPCWLDEVMGFVRLPQYGKVATSSEISCRDYWRVLLFNICSW